MTDYGIFVTFYIYGISWFTIRPRAQRAANLFF